MLPRVSGAVFVSELLCAGNVYADANLRVQARARAPLDLHDRAACGEPARHMKVAAIADDLGAADVSANLAQARAPARGGARRGRGPGGAAGELRVHGHGAMPTSARLARLRARAAIQDFLAATARRLGLWVIAGTAPIRVAGDARVAAASLVYDERGVRVARYDKIHLFDVDVPDRAESYRESANMAPGNTPQVVDTPVGRVGLAVCYDMRFPELFRKLSAAGAQLLRAAFGLHRADRAGALGDAAARPRHRESLLRDRARRSRASIPTAARPTATA